MCGIAGLAGTCLNSVELQVRLSNMQAHLQHRGPDDGGLFVEQYAGVGLAHARLAILDLSPLGHQPMLTPDSRYTIVFNGEIYNFEELRKQLVNSGELFTSQSDTEVVLRLYQRRGPGFVSLLQGMFAIAIWDRVDRTLFLTRDSFGIKPLYLWRRDGAIAFASEIRSLLKAKLGPANLCAEALQDYLLYGSVQEPLTLVEGITVLRPGSWMLWRNGSEETRNFWEPYIANSTIEPADTADQTREALNNSIRRHFVSDLPVSIFLSGGIDSTAVLALAHAQGHRNLRTFCLSFDETEFNEGALAARTAKHFGTEHHDWRITASEGQELIVRFLDALDQPSNDGFNTFCVSRFAHDNGVKVVLSGLGGDELFGGYPSFCVVPKLYNLHQRLRMVPWAKSVAGFAAKRLVSGSRGQRMQDFMQSNGSVQDAYRCMRGIFPRQATSNLVRRYLGSPYLPDPLGHTDSPDLALRDQVSLLEITSYMRNQLLRDSDVMSMHWGLELRVPFVDRPLFETIARISSTHRLESGKRLLLSAVPEIPEWIAVQPKRGFRFPFEQWIYGRWGHVFTELNSNSPVPLSEWYQTWTLFTLENFLSKCGIRSSDRLLEGTTAVPE